MPANKTNSEFRQLLTGLIDGQLDVPDLRRFEELLSASPERQKFYDEFMALHAMLLWRAGPPISPVGSDEIDQMRFQAGDAPASPPSSFIGAAWQGATGFLASHEFVVPCMVAIVLIGIAMWFGSMVHISRDVRIVENDPASAGPGSLNGVKVLLVGQITDMKDCRWADPKTATIVGAHVPIKRKYVLSSGLLEISYDSGARVILEGPCEYTVDSCKGGFLQVGKLVARVEKRGERREEMGGKKVAGAKQQAANSQSLIPNPQSLFCITTPTTVVTDLGTEFGVEVTENGRTTTAIFVGKVRLETVGSNGKRGASRVLKENQTGVVEPNNDTVFIGKNDDAKSFVRVIPQPEDVQEAEAYAKLVLSLDPVAYYRMERPTDGADPLMVLDSTSGRRHGTLRGAGRDSDLARLWNAGRFGGALRLRGKFFGDYVTAPSLPKSDANQLSCSVWVYLKNTDSRWPHIVAEGGGKTNVRFKLALREYSGCPCGRVTAKTGEYRELGNDATEPFPLRQWQHLAMVADGSNVKLYRNGVETASMPCNGISAGPLGEQLLIGCANMSAEPTEIRPEVFWNGRIDELAIFHRALSPDEIKRLSEGPGGRNEDGNDSSTLEQKDGKEAND